MSEFRYPFGPLRGLTERDFVEIKPVTRADGRVLRCFHLRGHPDLVFTEDPMDQTFEMGPIEPKPMEVPTGSIFFLNVTYGSSSER